MQASSATPARAPVALAGKTVLAARPVATRAVFTATAAAAAAAAAAASGPARVPSARRPLAAAAASAGASASASASASARQAPALPPAPARPTLYDVPVSNNGARVRYVVYSQGLDVAIESPAALGGLRSPEYLALSPNGKMPLLHLPAAAAQAAAAAAGGGGGLGLAALYESETIVHYLIDAHCPPGTLRAADPDSRARCALATRAHDLYVTTAQGCMYKGDMTPEQRSLGLAQLAAQLDALEAIVAAGGGPFIAGGSVTTADAALAPTFEFLTFILPRHFGWEDVFAGRPALRAWWGGLRARDAAMARVLDEVRGGLEAWEDGGRWQKLGIDEQVARAEARYAY